MDSTFPLPCQRSPDTGTGAATRSTLSETARALAEHAYTPVRRELHTIPELGFQEHETGSRVRKALAEADIPIVGEFAGTGFVAAIRRGDSPRAVGLRADLDGLAVTETAGRPHGSQSPGIMHACGHDGHVAMVLAAGDALATAGDFDGTVYLIFQPAEEGGGGARVMVNEGVFERFPMQHIFALHTWPGLPLGHVAVSPGPVMASTNDFSIRLLGPGGHVAFPHLTAPLVDLGAQVALGLTAMLGTDIDPMIRATIAVTQISGGTTVNAHPTTLEISGTVRAFSDADVDAIEGRMRAVLARTLLGTRASGEFTLSRNYPATVNHSEAVLLARAAAVRVLPADRIHPQIPAMTSEDFAFLLAERPGAYLFLGAGEGPSLHSPEFDFPDGALPEGAALLAEIATEALRHEGTLSGDTVDPRRT